MNDKELADQLDAQGRLRNRGYKRVKCDKCQGVGSVLHPIWTILVDCGACQGKGYHWQAPLTKEVVS